MEVLNPLEIREWDTLVAKHPQATVFHTSAWARLLVDAFGYTPLYFGARANGSLTSLMPTMEIDSPIMGRRGKTLPFTDYCSPLVGPGTDVQALVDRVVEHGHRRGWRSFELRGGSENNLTCAPQ